MQWILPVVSVVLTIIWLLVAGSVFQEIADGKVIPARKRGIESALPLVLLAIYCAAVAWQTWPY